MRLPGLVLLLVLVPMAAPGLPAVAVSRQSASADVTALAVAQTAEGFVGIHADVTATVLSTGSGRVFVATKPLAAQDMQASARLASQVAARVVGAAWSDHDFLVSFTSGSDAIGGPSAGAVMTLAFAAALHNLLEPDSPWRLDPDVAATGTINPDGTIGPVGGIPAKAEAAARRGIRVFLYPAGLEQAPTLVAGQNGPRQVTVDMGEHCASLGIRCRAVASLREVLEEAAGVRLAEPEVPVPETRDYGAQLSGTVGEQVDDLASRLAAAQAALADATLAAAEARRVQQELDASAMMLGAARAALANETYYLAATRSFQGAISVRRAEGLTGFFATGRSEASVQDEAQACARAVEGAEADADGEAATATQAWALGAARVRLYHAGQLLRQAEAFHEQAVTYDDWILSLQASAFCQERAGTVGFWAGLQDEFPAGPRLDAAQAALEAVTEAEELVTYAEAVLGASGDARAILQQAQAHTEDDDPTAALVAATEAGAAALVSLQTGAAGTVSQAVLEAAREGASRAVAEARATRAEPMLSVSLIELASDQQPDAALRSLWQARTLALLAVTPQENAAAWTPVDRRDPVGAVGPALVISVVLALATIALVVALLPPRRY